MLCLRILTSSDSVVVDEHGLTNKIGQMVPLSIPVSVMIGLNTERLDVGNEPRQAALYQGVTVTVITQNLYLKFKDDFI